MKPSFLAFFLVLVGCSGGGGGDWEKYGKGSESKMDPISVVKVESVARGTVSEFLATSATVESESQADVFPLATGRVLKVYKDDGDTVRRGDVLAVIENVSLDVGAERASSELGKLQADFDKLKVLHDRGAISDRELTDARHQLDAARSAEREALHTYGETKLRAPFSGVVAAREIRVGETASSGSRAFQVVDLSRLRVVAALPERDVGRVQVGQPTRLISAYDADRRAEGTVKRLAPVVDAASGTFRVTIELNGEQKQLRPGQFVSVEIEVEQKQDVLVIPKQALLYEDGLPVAYRMIDAPEPDEDEEEEEKADKGSWFSFGQSDEEQEKEGEDTPEVTHVAERVQLELGLVDNDFAEIVEGLKENDQVIVVGQSNLKDNSPIRVQDEVPDGGTAAAIDSVEEEG